MASRSTPSGPPSRGRREHRKHRTRRELLAAGRRLFAEQGLYDSRIEDLARQAGIAKGTLYGYFANKEELIEAVVTSGFGELLAHVHRAAQGATSREEVIARVTEAHLAFFAENPDLMRVFHQVRGLLKFNRPESSALRAVLDGYLAGLTRVLESHRPGPPARASDARSLAIVLFGAVSGVTSVRASLDGEAVGPAADGRTVRAIVALVSAFEAPGQAGPDASAGLPADGAAASGVDGR